MIKDEIQYELNRFYKSVLNTDTLKALKDKENLSAPLLLKIFDSYLQSKLKIMFIGKETNHWLTHKSRPLEKRGINYLINEPDEAFGALLNRYESALTSINKKTNNRFFSKYNLIKNSLVSTDVGSVIWNNLYKCSYDTNKGYSKNSQGHSKELDDISRSLLMYEIELLKPDVLIFVSGAGYDKTIKDYFDEYEESEVIIPKRLWKFKYKNIQCYRTIHPDYYVRNQKTEQSNYYQDIIDDIKKEFGAINV